MAPKSVERFADELFAEKVHQRRIDSIALGVVWVVHAVSLSIHAIGRGMAGDKVVQEGLDGGSTGKQACPRASHSAD